MTIKHPEISSIAAAGVSSIAALLAASVPTALLAQPPQAQNIELSEERQVPAEQTADAYTDPSWQAPETSWGDPSLQGVWSTDDMRGIPGTRPEEFGTQESLTEEQFLERARTQQAGRNRAVNEETFLRNEWGTRTFGFTSLLVDPPNGQMPELTAAGRARAEADRGGGTFGGGPFNTFDDFSLYDRCITFRGISSGTGAAIYGNGIHIVQSPNEIAITYEMIHETRIIPLDDRPHHSVEQYLGNSRGYWEDDTLVIETEGFNGANGFGRAPPSDQLKTTERLRRVDEEMIEYRLTVEDPDTFTAPFTYRTMWTTQPNYYPYEYSCHEGNTAVGGGLQSERAFERQVAEALANGQPPPPRSTGEIYRAPGEDAVIYNINRGE
jgi:hypothetical protein